MSSVSNQMESQSRTRYAILQPALNHGRNLNGSFSRGITNIDELDIKQSSERFTRSYVAEREKIIRQETRRRYLLEQARSEREKIESENERCKILQNRREMIQKNSIYIRSSINKSSRNGSGRSSSRAEKHFKLKSLKEVQKQLIEVMPADTDENEENKNYSNSKAEKEKPKPKIATPEVRTSQGHVLEQGVEINNVSEYQRQAENLKQASSYIKTFREHLERTDTFNELNFNLSSSFSTANQSFTQAEKISPEMQRRVVELRRKEYDEIIKQRHHISLLKRHELLKEERKLEKSLQKIDITLKKFKLPSLQSKKNNLKLIQGNEAESVSSRKSKSPATGFLPSIF